MTKLDQRLSAYLDGELAPEDAAELDELLASDPAAMARLEQLQTANSAFSLEAQTIDALPKSRGLQELEQRLGGTDDRQPTDKVTDLGLWRRTRSVVVEHRAIAAAALAAAIVGVSQIGGSSTVAQDGLPGTGMIYADTALGKALTVSVSPDQVLIGDAVFTPQLTYVGADDAFCRVTLMQTETRTGQFVACRNGEHWEVQVAAFRPGAADAEALDYQTASTQIFPAVEQYLDGSSASIPLSAAEESDLIENNWEKKSE